MSKPHGKPIHWILDFDGTITQHDTLNTLVSISASTKPSFPTTHHWSRVTKAYLEDYTLTLSNLDPGGKLPSTLTAEKKLLRELRSVEERSLARVSESSIFAGLTYEQLRTGAQNAILSGEIELRKGFSEFYNTTQSSTDDMTILSVNWSTHFIHSCLPSTSPSLPPSHILANDLEGLSADTPHTASTGHITPIILSSGDKLSQLERLRAVSSKIVYVGDSWTDVEALLAADVGICMRDERMGSGQRQLADALERVGVGCRRLGERGAGNVVWVRDWEEVRDWSETVGL